MALPTSKLDWEKLTSVRVTYLIDPATFWVVPLSDVKIREETESLLTLNLQNKPTEVLPSFAAGELVAVLHAGWGKWIRAEVQEAGDPRSLLFLVDHGMVVNMPTKDICPLPAEFSFKFLAVLLHLRGVQPVPNSEHICTWSKSAYEYVSSLLAGAQECYLVTEASAVDIVEPALFCTFIVNADNQLVDLGADLKQRGFATLNECNAIAALERKLSEPLYRRPNPSDPLQVPNPMNLVQSQNGYQPATEEQRRAADTIGRGRQRLPQSPPMVEHLPIQYIACGHNLSRVPKMNLQRATKDRSQPGSPKKGELLTGPPPRGGMQAKNLDTSGGCLSPGMESSSLCGSSPSRDISMQNATMGDSSFLDTSMAATCGLPMPASHKSGIPSSAYASPAVAKPSRRQFLEQLSAHLSQSANSPTSFDSSGSCGLSDTSFLAANDSFSSTDSFVAADSQPKGRSRRRDRIMAIAEANQPPVVTGAGDVVEAMQPMRSHLLNKLRDNFELEPEGLASVSQRMDQSSGNLSLMNVSEIESAMPGKKSRLEHLTQIAATERSSTAVSPKLEAPFAVDSASPVALLSTELKKTLHLPRESEVERPAATSFSAAAAYPECVSNQASNVQPNKTYSAWVRVPKEQTKSQMPLYRLSEPILVPEKIDPAPRTCRTPQCLNEEEQFEDKQQVIGTGQPCLIDDQGMVALKLSTNRVLVHGRSVHQVRHVSSAPFTTAIHDALSRMKVRYPTRLQQVSWPAVIEGDDIVMVAKPTAGMTLAYLAPLASLLTQPSRYQKLRDSCAGILNGPIVVILCSGFEECQKIEKMCSRLVRDHGISVVFAHGGGAEQEKEIELLNGCDILVTTPLCFYRLLAFRKLIVNLRRICHLVLSNADCLVEKFKEQLVMIMESCKESVRRRLEKGSSTNKLQVLAASNRWSLELYAVVNAISPSPLVIIGSYLEAAIYAGVQPKLDILPAAKKMDQVLGILSKQRGLHKSVVVCQNASKVQAIAGMLRSNKFLVLEAHELLPGFKRDDVRQEWKSAQAGSQRPVLVVSDPVLEDMLISDAVVLVHFDMPASKNGFGKRFSLLMDNYPDIHTADKDTVRDCQASVLVDEDNSEQLPGIVDFMRRLGAKILPLLEDAAKKTKLNRERDKPHLPFCPNMKAFGECTKNWNLCPHRHALLPSDESIHLPKCGRVKLKVLQVLSACRFSANLLEMDSESEEPVSLSAQIVQLAMEMALFFATSANRRVIVASVVVNEVVAVETAPGLYKRGRVEGVIKRDSLGQPTLAKLWMVDCGEWREEAASNLVELPKPLREWSEQAVEVVLCRAAPTDNDTAWSPAAQTQVCRWVDQAENDERAGTYFVGDIVLCLGNTLWLDPMQARRSLTISEADILVRSFRKDLVERRLAVDNPHHLTRLYEMCQEAGISVECYQRKKPQPAANMPTEKRRAPAKPRWQYLRDEPDYTVAFVSALDPGCIFVRLTQFEANLARLNADIRSHIVQREAELRSFLGEQLIITKGAICLAKYKVDGNWHRALVDSVTDDGASVEVFFVDHGDRATVNPGTEMVPITDWLVEYLPFMAIQCSLVGIKPLDVESWTNAATDLLYDITVNEAEMAKVLRYQVVALSENAASMSGVTYSVVLIDDMATEDSVLNRVLVEHGLAAYDDELRKHLDDLPRLVPRPATPPPEDDSELPLAVIPPNTSEDSSTNLVRLSDLANKSVSLTHEEGTVLADGEKSFDFEIDDVRSFLFRLMHGRAPDAEAKLQILESLSEPAKAPLPELATQGDQPTIHELAHGAETKLLTDQSPSPVPAMTIPDDDQQNPAVPEKALHTPTLATANTTVDTQDYVGVPGAIIPKVVWYQKLRTVHLSIEVVDVPTYSLETSAMGINFSAETRGGDKFAFVLGLFGALWPERTEHANTGRRISVILHKIYAGNWPHLLESGDIGQHWLRYNVDHATTVVDRRVFDGSDNISDEEMDEEHMRERVRHAQVQSRLAPHVSTLPADWRSQIVPHFQYEESDEDEDNDFIPPDKPYQFEDQNDPLNLI